jgi:hypothetical protein
MKPVQDTFTSHIQGLYEGHEVDAPSGVQDSVFNQLDAISATESGSNAFQSGSFTSKAILGAAVVIVGIAWYLAPISEDTVLNTDVVIEESAVATPAVDQIEIEAPVVVVPNEDVSEDKTETHVTNIEVVSTVAEELPIASEDATTVVEEEIPETNVTTVPIATEIVNTDSPVKVEEVVKEEDAKSEPVEWVLPASLEVDE